MQGPTVSVIVNAYAHPERLPEALASVSRQTEPAHEIVVVASAQGACEAWADRATGCPRTVLTEPDRRQGPRILRGIEACRGDVLAFLDDDDLWDVDKVARVKEAFRKNPDLTYYNHAHRETYGTERASGEAGRRPFWVRQRGRANGYRGRDPEKAHNANLGNSSSIAVAGAAREMARRWASSVDLAVDDFLFWAAVAGRGDIEIDPRVATEVRIHGSNTSRPTGDFESFRQKQAELTSRRLATWGVILGMVVVESGSENAWRRVDGEVQKALALYARSHGGAPVYPETAPRPLTRLWDARLALDWFANRQA